MTRRMVIYDGSAPPSGEGVEYIDGSDEMLPAAERPTAEDMRGAMGAKLQAWFEAMEEERYATGKMTPAEARMHLDGKRRRAEARAHRERVEQRLAERRMRARAQRPAAE